MSAQKNHSQLEELRFPGRVFVKKCRAAELKSKDLRCTLGHLLTKLIDLELLTPDEVKAFVYRAQESAQSAADFYTVVAFNDYLHPVTDAMLQDILRVVCRFVPQSKFYASLREIEGVAQGYPGEYFREFNR